MRRAFAWAAGLVLSLVLAVMCRSSAKEALKGAADLFGLGGLVGRAKSRSLIREANAAPGSPTQCVPMQGFCEGTLLFICAYSGTDARLGLDCATGTTSTNPGTCQSTDCGPTAKACCGRQKDLAQWGFTAPVAFSGHQNTGFEGQGSGELTTDCSGAVHGRASLDTSSSVACSANLYVSVSVDMHDIAVGQVVTLPNPNVTVTMAQIAAGVTTTCAAWTGSVTRVSADPSAQVSVDATCSEAGKSTIKAVGTISSNQ